MRRALPLLLLAVVGARAQNPDPSTLDGKVVLGYQGWFRCPGGGAMGTNWSHWANGMPTAASLVIDMYPDLREFEPGETCIVPGMTSGGNPVSLFSSGNSATVDRHFLWMRQYGIDGVLVQRFVTDIARNRDGGDIVLRNVMDAARRHRRVFAIEYDISGANAATLLTTLQNDWKYLVESLAVTAHPGYLHHNGKPLLAVWGIGLNDAKHPPNDPQAALQLIQWFRSEAQVSYLGGTPAYWRTLSNDAATGSQWNGVYQAMDAIQPWTVGRYSTLAAVERWKRERIEPDLAVTNQRGQIYMPVIFPGFSWYNLNRTAPQNQIPRNRGEFLWRQAYNARSAGARILKIAMFDEVNESTAMFKLAARRADAPDQGYWLTLDADGFTLPSDWYLRLAGEIARMFREPAPPAPAMPSNPGPPFTAAGAPPLSAVNAASFSGQAVAAASLATVYGEGLSVEAGALPSGLTLIDASGRGHSPTVLYASANQMNIVVPAEIATGPATLVAERGEGVLAYARIEITPVAPGVFSANSTGHGPAAAQVRLVRPDGTQSSHLVSECTPAGGCRAVPVDLGPEGSVAVLELYGTGIRGRTSLEAVTCTVGGIAAPVLYAGAQGGFAGLDQVNVLLPRSLAGRGLADIGLSVNAIAANAVQISIR
ncbi:MAG: hypothetical protein IPJ98_09280 [Bryobacterales bacterium]|nr:hypothetical protein [Bryobacterales bacterium]